jgi:putative RecB family exonuclease
LGQHTTAQRHRTVGKTDRIDPAHERADQPANRLTGPVSIIDYKSGRHVIDDEDIHDEPAAQVYALAAEQRYGREVERVRFIYLAHGIESRWEPEREDIEAARERLAEVTSRMYSDTEFEPNPGEHCGRCPFSDICPEAGRVELPDLAAPEDLVF